MSSVTIFLGTLPEKIAVDVPAEAARCIGEDTVIHAWGRWYAAHTRQNELSRRQQRLERKLLRKVGGFPLVELTVPDRSTPISARTADEIDRLLPGLEMEEARTVAKAELASVRNAWNKADSELGYSAAYAAENQAADRTMDLAHALLRAQALSIIGVIAKLHCLIEMEEPSVSIGETPGRNCARFCSIFCC
ncbi:hypothetical protein [Rhizobium sp. BK376]|uniref:hypothetical protein n=1 Tax=Rhizobium sp. BK376 TaxID=2512149 RepID=UPI001050253F|nr:hypothetical protein [Rhizobium sp. BK376]